MAAGANESRTPLVALRGLTKLFGTFAANRDVDLDLFGGEIHALLGENGAGKSTLVKMLYGLLAPTAGTVVFDGRPVVLRSPEQARALGIGMVFQHFSLFENLTVAENIALVMPKTARLASVPARIDDIGRRYGFALDPTRPVWTLSAGERQRIEIARCLLQDPKLVILDEPTSVLTPQEAETLFATLDRLKAEGRALLYISHRLDEVRRLCDRATILRRGVVVGACDPRRETARSLATAMVGTAVDDIQAAPTTGDGVERLGVRDLSLISSDLHGVDLRGVSFSVRGGEIFGIAGVAGNGQAELFAALSGETRADAADAITLDGVASGTATITQRRQRGAVFVPEERNGHAAAGEFSLADNAVLSRHALGDLARWGLIDRTRARHFAARVIERFDVRAAGPDAPARTLSGGNLQKFVVGREMLRFPPILVVDQPTWGVDAAAAASIRQALLDLAATGAAIVVISQDLDELFAIASRLAVIHDGHLSDAQPTRDVSREEIGLLMGGAPPVRRAEAAGAHAS